ncbi:hypothetical protein BH20ACI1_BH20ACI1_25840 [soil metagenome]
MKYSTYKFILLFTFVLLLKSFVFAQTEGQNGIELYNQGDFKAAIESLQKVVEINKEDYKALLYLGAAFVKTNDEKRAMEAFKKADKISFDKRANSILAEDVKTNDKKLKFISRPRVSYTDSARKNEAQGTIKLAVEFGADGKINFIFPFKKLEYGLTENAIIAAGKIKFNPAMKNDNPVTIPIKKWIAKNRPTGNYNSEGFLTPFCNLLCFGKTL